MKRGEWKMGSYKHIQVAKYGYVILSALFCLLGIWVIANPAFSAKLLCRLGGILLILFGIIKIIGYFSKDLYQLAFQYDLALGILLIALGAILLFRTEATVNLVCVLVGIYILADGLLKIQIALDAKKFGILSWWLIMVAAILTGVAGFLLVFRPYSSARAIMVLTGVTLLAEGVLNIITAITSVKIFKRQGTVIEG